MRRVQIDCPIGRFRRSEPVGRSQAGDFSVSDRFYVPENLDRTELELPADEAHHALHVLRKREGDRITLFNGRGCSAEARIVSTGRKSVRVAIETTSKRAELPRW
ncbi:MAG: hypothetical protein DWQ29_20330, partial [Planctomycetota bacterium]